MIERILLAVMLRILRLVRWVLQSDPRVFAMLGAPAAQPTLAWIGRMKAFQIYLKASRDCPAYREFLVEQHAPSISHSNQLSRIPATTKENYVKKYDIEKRCYGGRIPARGVVIDESSGSSGIPNSWVRGQAERSSVKAIMQLSYALMFENHDFFILNCFALGPWATGMNVSMSLVDVAIMKSIGPDKAKLENALKQFGPKYRYLIAGYPPFVKNFVDTTTLDLRPYELHLIVGGEGISEGLREYFGKWFKSIFSSYGASDLEINIGAETAFTIAMRQLCWKDGAISKALFGREDPPMIFQYNPLDYVIEQDANGEVIFTIARLANVAPKIRYNLQDRGGVHTHADLLQKLKNLNVDPSRLAKRASSFPILHIYGRSDLSVPFFGCKVFPTDMEHIIGEDRILVKHLNSFQIQNEEDEQFNRRLHLHLERSEGSVESLDESWLHQVFYNGLMRVNQDFREITKMIVPEQVRVTLHVYGTGPFAGRDIRIKNRYVAAN
jgi:phenylacetate-CoA ligase